MTQFSKARRHWRFLAACRVDFEVGQSPVSAFMVNMSQGGMMLRGADTGLAEGDELEFRLHLQDGPHPLRVRGRVLLVRRTARNSGVHIAFLPGPAEVQRLRRFVEQQVVGELEASMAHRAPKPVEVVDLTALYVELGREDDALALYRRALSAHREDVLLCERATAFMVDLARKHGEPAWPLLHEAEQYLQTGLQVRESRALKATLEEIRSLRSSARAQPEPSGPSGEPTLTAAHAESRAIDLLQEREAKLLAAETKLEAEQDRVAVTDARQRLQQRKLQEERERLEALRTELQAASQQNQHELTVARQSIERERQEVERAREKLERDRDALRHKEQELADQRAEAESRVCHAARVAEEQARSDAEVRESAQRARPEAKRLQEKLDGQRVALAQRAAELTERQQQLQTLQQEAEEERRRLKAERSALQTTRAELERQRASLQTDREELSGERLGLATERHELQQPDAAPVDVTPTASCPPELDAVREPPSTQSVELAEPSETVEEAVQDVTATREEVERDPPRARGDDGPAAQHAWSLQSEAKGETETQQRRRKAVRQAIARSCESSKINLGDTRPPPLSNPVVVDVRPGSRFAMRPERRRALWGHLGSAAALLLTVFVAAVLSWFLHRNARRDVPVVLQTQAVQPLQVDVPVVVVPVSTDVAPSTPEDLDADEPEPPLSPHPSSWRRRSLPPRQRSRPSAGKMRWRRGHAPIEAARGVPQSDLVVEPTSD